MFHLFLKVPKDSLYHFFFRTTIMSFKEHHRKGKFNPFLLYTPNGTFLEIGPLWHHKGQQHLFQVSDSALYFSLWHRRAHTWEVQQNSGFSRKLIRRILAGGCKQRGKHAVFWRRTETLGLLVLRGWPTENHGWKSPTFNKVLKNKAVQNKIFGFGEN